MTPSETATAKTIAQGGNPPWEQTFTHPRHGELAFKAKLPDALALVRHSVAMDNLLEELDAAPRGSTMILVAALAGMADNCLMDMPAIAEHRVEDPEDDTGRVRIEFEYYDPTTEPDTNFLTDVWLSFSTWRAQLLTPETVRAVGNSSAPTPGSGSSAPSAASGDSRPTTPGS